MLRILLEHRGLVSAFGQMYSELGEQQRDISLNEFVDFVHGHLKAAAATAK